MWVQTLVSENSKQAEYVEIAFYHEAMSAKPLFEIFRAITLQMFGDEHFRKRHHIDQADHDGLRGVLGRLNGEYDKLSRTRNDLLHGTWFMGRTSGDDPHKEFHLHRRRVKKEGLAEPADLPKNVDDLTKLAQRCHEAMMWVSIANACNPCGQREARI